MLSFWIGIIPLLLMDNNVNTSNLKHLLCYPAISKSVVSLSILTNITFWHPFVTIYVFSFNLVFNHFFVISYFLWPIHTYLLSADSGFSSEFFTLCRWSKKLGHSCQAEAHLESSIWKVANVSENWNSQFGKSFLGPINECS